MAARVDGRGVCLVCGVCGLVRFGAVWCGLVWSGVVVVGGVLLWLCARTCLRCVTLSPLSLLSRFFSPLSHYSHFLLFSSLLFSSLLLSSLEHLTACSLQSLPRYSWS